MYPHFDHENDLCTCGHVRGEHDVDVEFDGERRVQSFLHCEKCPCEKFEEAE